MTDPLSTCQNCGVKFEMSPDEVVSSKILCPACAAERRAKLRAAKAQAAAASAPTPKAETATATSEPTPARPGRKEYHAHKEELERARAEASARVMRIAWIITGSLALITVIVLLVVRGKHEGRRESIAAYEKSLDDFRDTFMHVDLKSEDQLKQAKARVDKERKLWKGTRIEGDIGTQLSKVNAALQTIIKTRSLVEKLEGADTKLAASPEVPVLGDLFTAMRDPDLGMQAADAGGDFKARYDTTRQRVADRYLEALRAAATKAASATTGEGLAPYGTLEDVLRTLVQEAGMSNDVDAQKRLSPMLTQTYNEINGIVSRMFDEAYQNKVQWTDLLGDPSAWTAVTSSSFKHSFGPLTLTNTAGDSAQSGGISYPAGDGWRDYVIDCEFKLDSGTAVFYTRIGEKMDTKETAGFTVGVPSGAKTVNVAVEYGKTYSMTISTIGSQIAVVLDGATSWSDDIKWMKSRKGEPGIVAQANATTSTSLTITRLRVRLLR